ncbi:MAG: DUF4388 domain-containing protein [Polyangiaceae bacterium]
MRDGRVLGGIGFPRLVEMIATGEIGEDDEVALLGEPHRAVGRIPSLARYLVPSSTATTFRVFPVGVPDYQIQLGESSLLELLARLRTDAETGALFVERKDPAGAVKRKEIYIREGRLLHVAASDRDELLGEYLIRRGALERGELEYCLDVIGNQGGRLGDTLVSLGMVDALDVFRSIRDLGRDRVAALCSWNQGLATFYRGVSPTHVEFPLDSDFGESDDGRRARRDPRTAARRAAHGTAHRRRRSPRSHDGEPKGARLGPHRAPSRAATRQSRPDRGYLRQGSPRRATSPRLAHDQRARGSRGLRRR